MKVDPKINHGCLGNVCFGDHGRADRRYGCERPRYSNFHQITSWS